MTSQYLIADYILNEATLVHFCLQSSLIAFIAILFTNPKANSYSGRKILGCVAFLILLSRIARPYHVGSHTLPDNIQTDSQPFVWAISDVYEVGYLIILAITCLVALLVTVKNILTRWNMLGSFTMANLTLTYFAPLLTIAISFYWILRYLLLFPLQKLYKLLIQMILSIRSLASFAPYGARLMVHQATAHKLINYTGLALLLINFMWPVTCDASHLRSLTLYNLLYSSGISITTLMLIVFSNFVGFKRTIGLTLLWFTGAFFLYMNSLYHKRRTSDSTGKSCHLMMLAPMKP